MIPDKTITRKVNECNRKKKQEKPIPCSQRIQKINPTNKT